MERAIQPMLSPISISTVPFCTSSITKGVPLKVAILTVSFLPVIAIAGMTNCDMLS